MKKFFSDNSWSLFRITSVVLIVWLQWGAFHCNHATGNRSIGRDAASKSKTDVAKSEEIKLFDGETLEGWKATNFGGEGEVSVEDGVIVLEHGSPLTGITCQKSELPTNHYELELVARKTAGVDFFCGLTFPVDDSHCTFIAGGWAGAVVGLSMIDGQDAANNETKRLMRFEKDRWYRIRVKVEPTKITAWIDDEQVVDLATEGKALSLRNETLPSRPLGICSFETRSEIRSVVLRRFESSTDQAASAQGK